MTTEQEGELTKLNYLFVINTYAAFGGAERQAIILAEELLKKSASVTFLALQEGEIVKAELISRGIKCLTFPLNYYSRRIKKYSRYPKLIRLIRIHNPDIIIPYVAESNKVVADIWRFTGAKFSFWNQREEGRNLFGKESERKKLLGVSSIVSNSVEGQLFLSRTYNIPLEEIHVINNGVNVNYISKCEYSWHDRLGLNKDDIIICMLANITQRKDHVTLLNAWSKVIKNYEGNSDLYLVLAGKPKKETTDVLKLLAFDLDICHSVRFVGFVKDVDQLCKESYLHVFSSNKEGCPNGILEAMAQGKAVVATGISGSRQALGETYDDLVFSNPNDEDDLAEKILNLLRKPKLLEEIGEYNLERVRSDFSKEKLLDEHLRLIRQALLK